MILITFVGHYTILEVNPSGSDSPPLGAVLFGTPLDTPSACGGVVHSRGCRPFHRIDSLLKLDHRKTVVDRVAEEDAREPLDDSYPSPAQEIG